VSSFAIVSLQLSETCQHLFTNKLCCAITNAYWELNEDLTRGFKNFVTWWHNILQSIMWILGYFLIQIKMKKCLLHYII